MSKPTCLVVWVAMVEALMLVALSTARADDASPMSQAESRLRSALEKQTSYEFVETPLADAINYLKENREIEIQFDNRALADAGITTDRPITKQVMNVPLRSALKLLLRDLDLTAVIRDDVLVVTTSQEAEGWRTIKIYDIRDLVPDGGYDRFIQDVRRHVAPNSWTETKGNGFISHFSTPGIDVLVVSQNAAAHEEIGNLLWNLRRLREQPKNK